MAAESQTFLENKYVRRTGLLAATASLLLGGCALQSGSPESTHTPSASSSPAPETLHAGDVGLPVAHLQQLLHDAGCEVSPDKPYEKSGYGKMTTLAVKTYQTNKGLPATGEATPELQNMLATSNDKYCGASQPAADAAPPFVVSEIDPAFAQRMVNVSWRKECLPISDLRDVEVPFHDDIGKTQMGHIIINHVLAQEVGEIFTEIYKTGYRIQQIKPIEDIAPPGMTTTSPAEATKLDEVSMRANNTSGFNCRALNGKVDKHGLADAIDVSTCKNPMKLEKDKDNVDSNVDPKECKDYLNPNNQDPAIIRYDRPLGAKVIAIFKNRGWRWGGDWKTPFDPQHFDRVPQ